MNGLLVIDKPAGMTSRDAVNRVQRWFPRKTKIGHTGTLDPLATGVLVVCIGAATRLAHYVQAMGKTYISRFRLGASSTTDDADGDITETPNVDPPTREQIDVELDSFIGMIEQVPPAVSALKLAGVRSHELVRRGLGPKLAARVVTIHAIGILHYDWPFLDVEVECGKGTYIRSIARDLGAKIGCGGLVQTLRRTRIGPFTAEQGTGRDVTPEEVRTKLLPMSLAVSTMPRLELAAEELVKFSRGRFLKVGEPWCRMSPNQSIAILNTAGDLVAVGRPHDGDTIRPEVVLVRE